MNGHDSPFMEAMAFNPVNLGPLLTAAVNNLWTWLAVIATAAFRFGSLPTTPSSNSNRISPAESSSKKQENQIQEGPQTTPSCDSTHISTTAKTCSGDSKRKQEEEGVLTRGNTSKELVMVCFKEERENEGHHINHDDDDDDGMDGGDEAMLKRWPKVTILTVEMRRAGDLGWYEYQDRRVIDGSVVRLWEEVKESSRSPRSNRPRRFCRC